MLALVLHVPPADVWGMAPRDMATLLDILKEQQKGKR